MFPHEPLRICTTCRIPHYENCPDCAGWGRYISIRDGKPYPVMAAESHGDAPMPPNLEACPTCGSMIAGAPTISACRCGQIPAPIRPEGWTKWYVRCACGNCERGANVTPVKAIEAWNRATKHVPAGDRTRDL